MLSPMPDHQRALLAMAKAAGSWSQPTLTQPKFFATSYTPYGIAFGTSGSMKSWTLTFSGWPFRLYSRPELRYLPISSFFFVSTEITSLRRRGLIVIALMAETFQLLCASFWSHGR